METIEILRDHVESSTDFANASEFFDILDKATCHLQRKQDDHDRIEVVRCINIEGRVLI